MLVGRVGAEARAGTCPHRGMTCTLAVQGTAASDAGGGPPARQVAVPASTAPVRSLAFGGPGVAHRIAGCARYTHVQLVCKGLFFPGCVVPWSAGCKAIQFLLLLLQPRDAVKACLQEDNASAADATLPPLPSRLTAHAVRAYVGAAASRLADPTALCLALDALYDARWRPPSRPTSVAGERQEREQWTPVDPNGPLRACVKWVCDALAAHRGDGEVAQRALRLLAAVVDHTGTGSVWLPPVRWGLVHMVVARAVAGALGPHAVSTPAVAVEAARCLRVLASRTTHAEIARRLDHLSFANLGLSLLVSHAGDAVVVEHALHCLADVAGRDGCAAAVAHALPVATAALATHGASPGVAEAWLALVTSLAADAACVDNVTAVLPAVAAVTAAHPAGEDAVAVAWQLLLRLETQVCVLVLLLALLQRCWGAVQLSPGPGPCPPCALFSRGAADCGRGHSLSYATRWRAVHGARCW